MNTQTLRGGPVQGEDFTIVEEDGERYIRIPPESICRPGLRADQPFTYGLEGYVLRESELDERQRAMFGLVKRH